MHEAGDVLRITGLEQTGDKGADKVLYTLGGMKYEDNLYTKVKSKSRLSPGEYWAETWRLNMIKDGWTPSNIPLYMHGQDVPNLLSFVAASREPSPEKAEQPDYIGASVKSVAQFLEQYDKQKNAIGRVLKKIVQGTPLLKT